MEPVRGGQGGGGQGSIEKVEHALGYGIGIGLGKGLYEPCSPYRSAYAFGAEIGSVYADNWNCYAYITDQATSYDLSSITINHEVLVALSVFTNIYFKRTVRHKFYRTRDNALLRDLEWTIPDPSDYGYDYWEWYYFYSCLAWMASEISENGDYYWEMTIDGDTRRIDFTVSGIPKVYAGHISQRELEYNETRGSIPVSDVPQGKEGLVHIWGCNDMDETQQMGIYWVVRGPPGWPDGPILEEYYAWEAWPYTGPGQSHEFIGGRFNLDEVGLYDIRCGLLMNPDEPVYVDVYYGDLCTVAAVEPEFQGFALSEYNKV